MNQQVSESVSESMSESVSESVSESMNESVHACICMLYVYGVLKCDFIENHCHDTLCPW